MWTAIAVMVASWALGRLLQTKTDDVTQTRPEVDFPLAQEGEPMPLCYGTVRLRTPQVMYWDADMQTHSAAWVGEGQGEYMRGTLQLGIGIEVANNDLYEIYVGDSVRWNGTTGARAVATEADGSRILFDDSAETVTPTFKAPGGWANGPNGAFNSLGRFGKIRWYAGNFTQGQNAHLVTKISDPVPNFRGMAYVIFEDCNISPFNTPATISFQVRGHPDAANGPTTREIGSTSIPSANPAEIIYDLLTNSWGRLGIATADVDIASFQAAAVTLHGETMGIDVLIPTPSAALEVVREILRHIDGLLYEDIFTGTLKLKLVREDYVFATLPIFNDSDMDIAKVEMLEQTLWEDAIDQVRMNLEEPRGRNMSITAQNMATYYGRVSPRIRNRDINYKFIKRWSGLADGSFVTGRNIVPARELTVASTPIKRARLPFNRQVIDLLPGSVFRWTSAVYGITDAVMRVANVNYGTPDDGTIVVECFEDRFALDKPVYGAPLDFPARTLPAPVAATVKKTIEMPQWLGYRAEVQGLVPSRDHVRLFYFAKAPTINHTRYRPLISEDGGTTYVFDDVSAKLRFNHDAQVETAYLRTNEPYDTVTGLRIDAIDDTALLKTQTVAQVRAGGNLILVGNELMSYESATDMTGGVWRLNNVWRGLLDTVPVDHALNAAVWFIDDAETFLENLGAFGLDGDEAMKIRLQTLIGPTQLDTSALTPEDLTLANRSLLPYPVADFKVDNSKAYPGVAVVGETNNWVVEPEITGTWNRRLRTNESIQRGNDASETPEANTTYNLDADEGGGFHTIANADAVTLTGNLQLLGDGPGSIRCRTKRADAGGDKFSFQDPSVLAQFAHYRQLLINPGFEDPTAMRGWTITAGTALLAATKVYKFKGNQVSGDGVTVTFEQVVDIAALTPSTEKARLVFKRRNLSSGNGGCVRVRLISEDSAGTDLDTADSGTLSASTASWDTMEISIASMNAATVQLRVIVDLTFSAGAALDGSLDEMDLRVGKGISTQQVANGGFNTNLASWTVTNMSRVTANNTEGAGWARGNAAVATCDMWQEFNLPTGFVAGDVVLLRCIRFQEAASDTANVLIEARDVASAVLATASTGDETVSTSFWEARELYLKIPANTTKFRVTFKGTRVAGADLEVGWDDVAAYVFDIT